MALTCPKRQDQSRSCSRINRRPSTERALTAFKANATRQMREDGCWRRDSSPWAEKGSNRYLWNERSVAQAIDYVLYGQGDEPPDFDD